MLFLFNHPGSQTDDRMNAQVHLEVIGESESKSSMPPGFLGQRVELLNILTAKARPGRLIAVHRSSRVHSKLVPGFQGSISEILEQTRIRWFGLQYEEGLRVEVQCELLGGFF